MLRLPRRPRAPSAAPEDDDARAAAEACAARFRARRGPGLLGGGRSRGCAPERSRCAVARGMAAHREDEKKGRAHEGRRGARRAGFPGPAGARRGNAPRRVSVTQHPLRMQPMARRTSWGISSEAMHVLRTVVPAVLVTSHIALPGWPAGSGYQQHV